MPERPADLPDFQDPPVVEVALAIQFEPLEALRSVHFGLLWAAYKDRFPFVEDQPPLVRFFETFGGPPPSAHRVRLQLMEKPDMPRVWFLNEPKTQLVQFQADRFARNWRKLDTDEVYPRFEGIRDSFMSELEHLAKFADQNELGAIKPDWCEVTYINHIESVPNENLCRDTFKALKLWSSQPPPASGLLAEDGRLDVRYIMVDEEEKPIGRLTVSATSSQSQDERPMIALTLTARGKPHGESLMGVADFLNRGRATIVHAFAALTTNEMHARWGRRH